MGIGGVALAWLLGQEKLLADPKKPLHIPRSAPSFDLKPQMPGHAPQARAMISLFMHGGPSHIDLFDPKPELEQRHGDQYEDDVKYSFTGSATKKIFASPWKFQQHGACGTAVSELLPHTAGIVDDICVIRSMRTGINGHEPSIWYMNTGKSEAGRPALGSWLTYGLGSESQELPAYAVLIDPLERPTDGPRNWSSGWLPPIYQGTVIRAQEPRILNLDPPPHLEGPLQEQNLAFLDQLNRRHLDRHPGQSDLEARIASYELAAAMQTAATEAFDLSGESEATKRMYGMDEDATRDYGTRCLIARRLVERGVRFVQVFINGGIWDHHVNIREGLAACCQKTDKPSAALIKDLKQRGMLDTTIVQWGGEIGRLPVVQGDASSNGAGRDHNGQGFSMWLAGGGIRGGMTYGETDAFGHRAVVNPVNPNDYHATLLHLFGIDHTKLVYQHNSREEQLTVDPSCRIVHDILKMS